MFGRHKDLGDQNPIFSILKPLYSCVVCYICFAKKFMLGFCFVLQDVWYLDFGIILSNKFLCRGTKFGSNRMHYIYKVLCLIYVW
jgi:hypothetical protein